MGRYISLGITVSPKRSTSMWFAAEVWHDAYDKKVVDFVNACWPSKPVVDIADWQEARVLIKLIGDMWNTIHSRGYDARDRAAKAAGIVVYKNVDSPTNFDFENLEFTDEWKKFSNDWEERNQAKYREISAIEDVLYKGRFGFLNPDWNKINKFQHINILSVFFDENGNWHTTDKAQLTALLSVMDIEAPAAGAMVLDCAYIG